MYNQVPDDAVEALVGFMQQFQMKVMAEEGTMFGAKDKTTCANSPPSVLNSFAFMD